MNGQRDMIAFLVLCISAVSGEYLFTLPRNMEAGSTTYFCLVLKDMQLDGFLLEQRYAVTVDIAFTLSDKTSTSTHTATATYGSVNTDFDFQTCDNMTAPLDPGTYSTSVNVSMSYTPDGENTETTVPIFESKKDVTIHRPDLITLIQTDKPIYKPEQTVKFRVMTMDYKLMAKTDGYQQITIETPAGLRVMQWDDVPSPYGLVSLEMPLSSDPVLGSWKIKVLYGSKDIVQAFTVDEYVLPKFEVTVTPPKYLLPTTQTIHGTVCAKYTYGKPVKGRLTMSVCFLSGYYYYREERPCTHIIEKIDGCYEFFINAENIKLGRRKFSSWGLLKIHANVTEEQTGIELSGHSEGPRLKMYPLDLKMEDDTNNYFKPGFPYKGRVIVTNPDGSPAPGEPIVVEGSSYKSDFSWSNNFTTDVNGIVHFVITDLDSDVGRLNLHANAVVYEYDWRYTTDELYFHTYTPQAYIRLTQWYSPSNSYIYIPDVDEAVECGSELMLDVYYSAEMGDGYKFTAIVMAGDRVMYTLDHAITTGSVYNLDILSVDKSQVLVKAPKPTLPPIPTLSTILPLPEKPDLVETTAEEEVIEEEVIEDIIEPEFVDIFSGSIRKKRDIGSNLIGYFKLALPVYQDMGPSAKVLVFYMRKDKEIIASSMKFNIKSCFKNKVSMTFDETTVRPGTDVNLNIGASPNSRCFVGMVDKSVNLLGGNNQLTPSQVFENVRRVARPYRFTSYWMEDRDYCRSKQPPPEEGEQDYYYYGWSNPDGVDATQAFRDAGMWVETDGVLESRPCTEMRHYHYSYMRGPGGLEQAPVALASEGAENNVPLPVDATDKEEEPEGLEKIRSFFPETWLWEIVKLGDDGKLELTTTIPDTITEWVGNALCTHENDGIGVTELTGITAFQPFFVSMTLPYSAIRGEVLPLLVTVFNYLPDCITLKVDLQNTEGFKLTNSEDSSRQFCLCGGESQSTKFHIMPVVVGEIDLEVTAVSTDNVSLCDNRIVSDIPAGVADGVQRQLLIEAEGVPQDLTKSSYVCVQEGDMLNEVIEMSLPADMVPDSERAVVSVVGDIMGPTLSNLKNLLRMPYGCGEQNMASWSPNIYVLQYLANTNQLTEEIEYEAEGYMRVGYQRQMKYRHNDNSYSAWGENSYGNRTGSLWLTAFVVKSMAQSSAYITIDMDDIERSARWLVSKQTDGCYPQIGKVFSSYLKGGFDGDNQAGLTAFTLIALLEANLGEEFSASIEDGFTLCLDKFDVESTDTYTLTVMSYAYTLYKNDWGRRNEVMNELQARRVRENGLVFWRRDDEDSPVEHVYGWWYRAPSAEVEMTAYVLMSMLAEGPDVIGIVQPIVKWITKQRNPYGGFSSTQDTVVALQALAKFGEMTYTGFMSVKVEIKNLAIDHMFTVTASNSLVYQSRDVSPRDGAIEIATSGIGCALVQMNLKYNIYKEDNYAGPAFQVTVMVYKSRRQMSNCAMRTLDVCARYLKPGGVSNMAIAEVKMPTGWIPVKDTLQELVMSGVIQQYEIEKNYVEIYFDELTRDKLCIDFDVEQEIRMNPKPSLMKVYDYYETRYSITAEYEIKTTCGTKQEIPHDNAGLDCNIVQCRNDVVKYVDVEILQTCPTCLETIDETELEVLACDSYAAYKAKVGRSGKYSIKLKANILPKQKVAGEQWVNYKMATKCSCPQLESQSETRAIIFTNDATLYTNKKERDEIGLDGGDTVIPFTLAHEGIIRKLATRTNLCTKLKRLRRSGRPDSRVKLQRLRRKYGVL